MSDLGLLMGRATGITRRYEVNNVPPDNTPEITEAYAVFNLDPGIPINRRKSGDSSSKVRRLTVQCFGRSWDAVTELATKADDAYKDQTLTELADDPFSTRDLSFGPIRDPDLTGLLQITNVYRF